jgi:methionine-rich copper-binding protein CopC
LEITFDENINKGTGNITISGTGFTQTVDVTTNAVKVAGKKATIDLAQTLPFATAISVTVPQGAFEDQAGNDFAGLAASAWTFTTVDAPAPIDNTAPVVSGLSPADEATGVAENAKLEITFSEEVKAGTGNVTITVNGTPQTVDVTTNAVKINKEKVTIDASANFPASAEVSVVVPAGTFEDIAANDFAGLAAGSWNFTVKPAPTPTDNTAPVVAGLTPANGATNVAAVTSSLEITFDENINKATGNITITGTGFTQTIDVTTNAVKVAGKKATIDLTQTLPFATALSVTVPLGAFEDETGNDFAGLAASAWTFTTTDAPTPTDNTAPVVSGLSPADEATGVAENTKLEITFSEEVRAGNGNITITVNGTVQTVDVTTNAVKINKEKVTIDAAANFPEGAEVSVVVPAGAFEDIAANDFAGLAAGSWNFTVKPAPTPTDNTPPVVAGLTPANGATNVAAVTSSLEITFDENINKATGNITISGTGFTQTIDVTTNAVKVAGKKATIDLAQTLPFATALSVTVPLGAFEDETGNDFAGLAASAWTFTTTDAPTPTDNTAPVVSGLSPADEATGVAENTKLEITFSEEVRAGNGNITITVNGTVQTVDVTTNAVKINKEKVTIDAAANFPEGAEVSVVVPAGAFEDQAGNDFAGLAAGGWNFTVKPAPTPTDNTPPVVASLEPPHNATNVPVNANLVITFDENVEKGTGSITLNQGATSQVINLDDAAVEVAGKRVTINPPADFPPATDVSVVIPAGAFRDARGNPFAGITAETWRFATAPAPPPVDNTPPVVTNLSPADDATDVAPNAKLVLTFSENILKGTATSPSPSKAPPGPSMRRAAT